MQEVMAAMTTSPWPICVILARHLGLRAGIGGRHAQALGQLGLERAGGVLQQHAVLRALRPGQRGLHGGEVELQRVGEDRVGRGAPQALRLGIGLDQLDALLVTAGQAQIVERDLVDGEEAAGGAVFRGHVGDGGTVGERHLGQAGAVEFDELADDLLARSICVTVSTRSVAVAPSGSLPVSLKPITSGISMAIGWPSMAASASMPPTPQPSTPRPFTMVVWLSVPYSVSGYT